MAFPGNGSPKVNKVYEIVKLRKKVKELEREVSERLVVEKFELHKGRYGHRRINREPRKDGIVISEKRVLSIMRRLGLQTKGATRKHRRAKAVEMGDPRVNLVNRIFEVDARNHLWVGDITYINASGGWLYLAAAIDAWHRKAIGWSMSGRITEKLAWTRLSKWSVGRIPLPTSALCSMTTKASSARPAHSSAAWNPMASPSRCQGLATHGTTRLPDPSSRP